MNADRFEMNAEDRQLEDLAKRLGAAAGARLDVDRTAEVVVERLRHGSGRAVWWRQQLPVFGGVAAAALVVLVLGMMAGSGVGQHRTGPALAMAPAGLQELSEHELEEVFDSLSFEAPVFELASNSLNDMTVGQLEELLQTLMEE